MAGVSCTLQDRHTMLGNIVLRLFPKIMQLILKDTITPKGLKTKYKNKNLHVALTDAEISLLEQLPNTDNFTVGLCYKILRFEHLIDEPKCEWFAEPHDTELDIGSDIQRMLCLTNELLCKKTDNIYNYYYSHFVKMVEGIVSRVDIYLDQGTCQTLYQEIKIRLKNKDTSTCLQELSTLQPIDEIHNSSTIEECKRRERVSRIACVIIDKFPHFLRCIITKRYTPNQIYRQVVPNLKKYKKEQQINLQDLKKKGTFDSLDITLMYQILREYSIVQAPSKGWGEQPASTDLTIADDIERIRMLRNKLAHRSDIKIDHNTFESYFSQFRDISHRIDVYLGYSTNPSCEQEIITCKTCPIDVDFKVKYENALKRLENIKLRFESKQIKFCYGDKFETTLQNLRYLLKEEKIEGNETIRFQIVVGNENELDEAAPILNKMKDAINQGLIGIEFKIAYRGSVILYVQVKVVNLETDKMLQSVVTRLMERILQLEILYFHKSKPIDAVFVTIEEYNKYPPIEKKEDIASDKHTSLCYIDFDVDAHTFETDDKMQSKLQEAVTNVFKHYNGKENVFKDYKGKEQRREVTFLPINLGEERTCRYNNTFPLRGDQVQLSSSPNPKTVVSHKVEDLRPLKGNKLYDWTSDSKDKQVYSKKRLSIYDDSPSFDQDKETFDSADVSKTFIGRTHQARFKGVLARDLTLRSDIQDIYEDQPIVNFLNLEGVKPFTSTSCMECVKALPVFSSSEIKEGDHIMFDGLVYDHHAIVVSQLHDDRFLIIELEITMRGVFSSVLSRRKIAHISKFEKYFDYAKQNLRVIAYRERPYTMIETVKRARHFLDNDLTNEHGRFGYNSEHFATYCVTGRQFDIQVTKLSSRLLRKTRFMIRDEIIRNERQYACGVICGECFEINRRLLNIRLRPIVNAEAVKTGNIIRFNYGSFWHDGVVLDIEDFNESHVTCYVAHYVNFHLSYRTIIKEKLIVSFDGNFKIVEYDPSMNYFYDTGSVVNRALSRLGEQRFDFFSNDSSHFSRWCKILKEREQDAEYCMQDRYSSASDSAVEIESIQSNRFTYFRKSDDVFTKEDIF